MSASGGSSRVNDAWDRASNYDSIGGAALEGVTAILFAIVSGVMQGIFSIADLISMPIGELANAGVAIINAIFIESVGMVLGAGAAETVRGIRAWGFGPFGLMAAVGILLGTWYLVAMYRDEEDTGNLIPGLPYDIPFIGETEEDQD